MRSWLEFHRTIYYVDATGRNTIGSAHYLSHNSVRWKAFSQRTIDRGRVIATGKAKTEMAAYTRVLLAIKQQD